MVDGASNSLVFKEDRERLNADKTLKAVGGWSGGVGEAEGTSKLGLAEVPPSEIGEAGAADCAAASISVALVGVPLSA